MPDGVVYVEPFRRRVRGVVGGPRRSSTASGRCSSTGPAQPPTYAFPAADVDGVDAGRPEPEAPGHVRVPWDAVDAWYEEDEQVFGHPRNPYHRVDCVRTSRRLRVEVAGAVLVDTTETIGVYETALAPKLYVRPRRGAHATCSSPARPRRTAPTRARRRTGARWSATSTVADVAWSYEDPLPESLPIKGLLSFDAARVTVVADLPPGGAA